MKKMIFAAALLAVMMAGCTMGENNNKDEEI